MLWRCKSFEEELEQMDTPLEYCICQSHFLTKKGGKSTPNQIINLTTLKLKIFNVNKKTTWSSYCFLWNNHSLSFFVIRFCDSNKCPRLATKIKGVSINGANIWITKTQTKGKFLSVVTSSTLCLKVKISQTIC